MAVVTVTVTDAAPIATKWEMPGNYEGLRSPIPRGLISYYGTDAIATLSAGDETAYKLTLTMPPGFAYLLKAIMLRFQSDDLVANFGLRGLMSYGRSGEPQSPAFTLVSPGEIIVLAVQSNIIWAPVATTSKLMMLGADVLELRLSDMDAGGSTAGDIKYFAQFYVFDVDQVDKWEVNTPIPVISHTSF